MSAALDEPAVRAYLAELRQALAGRPAEERELVLDGVRQHIEDATAGATDPADVQRVLNELGDPVAIAAESAPDDGGPAQRVAEPIPPLLERRGGAILTVLVLVFGGFVVPLLGWIAGVVLLWTSRGWRTVDKVIGTVAAPLLVALGGAVLLALGAASGAGSSPAASTVAGSHLVVLSLIALVPLLHIAVGVWLLIRFRPRD